jgi:hypothetical protein
MVTTRMMLPSRPRRAATRIRTGAQGTSTREGRRSQRGCDPCQIPSQPLRSKKVHEVHIDGYPRSKRSTHPPTAHHRSNSRNCHRLPQSLTIPCAISVSQ